jgi:hypothetical protein
MFAGDAFQSPRTAPIDTARLPGYLRDPGHPYAGCGLDTAQAFLVLWTGYPDEYTIEAESNIDTPDGFLAMAAFRALLEPPCLTGPLAPHNTLLFQRDFRRHVLRDTLRHLAAARIPAPVHIARVSASHRPYPSLEQSLNVLWDLLGGHSHKPIRASVNGESAPDAAVRHLLNRFMEDVTRALDEQGPFFKPLASTSTSLPPFYIALPYLEGPVAIPDPQAALRALLSPFAPQPCPQLLCGFPLQVPDNFIAQWNAKADLGDTASESSLVG